MELRVSEMRKLIRELDLPESILSETWLNLNNPWQGSELTFYAFVKELCGRAGVDVTMYINALQELL